MWRLKLWQNQKRESGQAGRKKKGKKRREKNTSLSTCPVCATFALKSEALGEEGDELERALMVFFPGKKQPNNDIKKSN